MSELKATPVLGTNETDFLTPQQRLEAIAEILATIALRAVKQDHEDQNP
ncbi:hypothetical protein IAD21_06013 [Abditibacteriota bacterium]|nr:hypothetical protein IAD21_06013 [Abditibacteriota bacterium]